MSYLIAQLKAALAGRYAVERELGSGGMATIFLAEDLRHHRRVAIKVLDPEVAAALGVGRFMREIESAARLSHPHILPLHDSGEAGGLLYYVMPFVEGESLRHRLEREKQLPLEDALRLTSEVADALDYAHRQGVVHRDIKPENILLQERHAVVADFGIARAIASAGGASLTATGVVIGTPQYMSPEQVTASREVDGRCDQYSLACVLYEMLAGEPPFRGPTGESLAHQHLNVAPRPVRALRTAVPEGVDQALTKAMAKPAADRYGTVAEFAAALQSSSAVTRRSGEEAAGTLASAGRPARRGRWLGIAAAAVLVVLGALAIVRNRESLPRWLGGVSSMQPVKKEWMLVAEFDGPAEDSLTVSAIRDLVIAALDQSEVVKTVPRDQLRLALQNAGRPASTRVDAQMAHELAYRSAVRTVLEGRVGRVGQSYTVVLRLVDADSSNVVMSVSDAARGQADLIATVGRIAKHLRAVLGERRSAIQATRRLVDVTTPSFEAFKMFLKARELHRRGDARAAISVSRGALALDPDFASAWANLGFSFFGLNESDSALAAYREALGRPERLTKREEFLVLSDVARLNGDAAGALGLAERFLQLEPEYTGAHNSRGICLATTGRWAEAIESYQAAERFSAFGPSQIILGNQFSSLLVLGRVDEARRLALKLKGRFGLTAHMNIAEAANEWPAAESLAKELQHNPAADLDSRTDATWVLAAVQGSRGEVAASAQTLRQMQSEAEADDATSLADFAAWGRIMLALFSRGVAADPGEPAHTDSTMAGLVRRGVWLAAAGDTAQARRLLATVRTRSVHEVSRQGFTPALLEAWIAARGGRRQDMLRIIGPAALQGECAGYAQFQSAPLMRWMAAEAYEQVGPPDSAAAYFERAIAPPPVGGSDFTYPRMAFSLGHRRLVLLYARMGRLEDARRHWEIFHRTFTHPDPEMVPLVEEARAAVANAEAMARSARR